MPAFRGTRGAIRGAGGAGNPPSTSLSKRSRTENGPSCFVFTGEGTAFSGHKFVSVEDIKDDTITFQPGDRPTANTILVVEFKMDVPWTKPEDIDYPADPLNPPHLSSWYDDRVMALMADGSARGFPIRMDKEVSRALIEISDGSVIDWSKVPNLTK